MALTDVGATPVIQTSAGYDGMFGNSWLGILLVIALLGGGGFGFGGYGRNGVAAVDSAVFASQQFNQLDNGIRGIQNGICSSTYDLNNSIKDGFYSTAMGIQGVNTNLGNALCTTTYELAGKINDVANQMQSCCCKIERGIDGVNFNAERNASAIIQNATANTQRILDYLSAKELADKNQQIFDMSQKAQTAEIIAAMKPVAPIPAYIQPNPYASYSSYGCGCNSAFV